MESVVKSCSDVKSAFEAVSKSFPFKNYLTSYCYYQVAAITHSLAQLGAAPPGLKLLDVGCGPMDKTAILQSMGYECSAADDLRDPWHLLGDNRDRIIDFANSVGINFCMQEENDYTTPFQREYFDIVTSIAVIEHLHDSPRLILNDMGSYLKPEGYLVVVMPNSVNLRKRLSVLLGKTNYNPVQEMYYSLGQYRGHVREYTLDETQFICRAAGFKVVYANTFEHIAYSRLPFGPRELYLLLGKIFRGFRSSIIVIAQKPLNWRPLPEDADRYFSSISSAVPLGVLD